MKVVIVKTAQQIMRRRRWRRFARALATASNIAASKFYIQLIKM